MPLIKNRTIGYGPYMYPISGNTVLRFPNGTARDLFQRSKAASIENLHEYRDEVLEKVVGVMIKLSETKPASLGNVNGVGVVTPNLSQLIKERLNQDPNLLTPLKKGNDMYLSSTDTNALMSLAKSKVSKKAESYGVKPSVLGNALKEALSEKEQQAAKDAAQSVIKLFDTADKVILEHVDQIRRMQKAIKTHRKALANITRAKQYGLETENFLPLAVSVNVGQDLGMAEASLLSVPKDWNPSSSETSA